MAHEFPRALFRYLSRPSDFATRALGTVLLMAAGTVACSSVESGASSAAAIEKGAGAGAAIETFRETKTGLAKCDDSESARGLTKSKRYLEEIVAALVAANPTTFRGALAPEKFCIAVVVGEDRNGNADPFSGLVRIETSVIARAANDAQVAGIVAHELAHVTMRHGVVEYDLGIGEKDGFERVPPKVREDAAWRDAKKKGDDAAAKKRALELVSKEELANSAELEADSVGLVLSLRAGLAPAEFTWGNRIEIEAQRPGPDDAPELTREQRLALPADWMWKRCLERIEKGEVPDRGADVHPSDCYRVYNARVTVPARMKAAGEERRLASTETSLGTTTSLKDAQDELKADAKGGGDSPDSAPTEDVPPPVGGDDAPESS
ncbi:MAG: M48 family metalloprotease [Polyangiaceae bacterium]